MKKTVLFGASVLALTLVGGIALAHSGGVYNAKKIAYTDILIDGKLNDAAWKTAEVGTIDEAVVPAWQMFKTQVSSFDPPKDSNDVSAKFMTAYNDEYLFFAIDVKDDVLQAEGKIPAYQFDSVEVWLDGQGLANGKHVSALDGEIKLSPKLSDSQPGISAARMDTGKDAWKEDNLKLRPGVTVASVVKDGGYVIEACVPWVALEPWIGKHGPSLGFDVQINDNDAGKDAKGVGIRQTEMIWSGGKDQNYADTKLFGDLNLQ